MSNTKNLTLDEAQEQVTQSIKDLIETFDEVRHRNTHLENIVQELEDEVEGAKTETRSVQSELDEIEEQIGRLPEAFKNIQSITLIDEMKAEILFRLFSNCSLADLERLEDMHKKYMFLENKTYLQF